MLQFRIEQIAINPIDPMAAKKLLAEMGAVDWVEDKVVAEGTVFDLIGQTNSASLSFNYDLLGDAKEFEVLSYEYGVNWMSKREYSVSHLGMHCSAAELVQWRAFFKERHIDVAQEVMTQSHSNPVIAGKRWYNYVIFDTRGILGVDIKFIVRRHSPGRV